MKVHPEEISAIAWLVNDICGVVLDETKGYLIDSRLGNLAVEAGCNSFAELPGKARDDPALQRQIIDAIATQETLFFRDSTPFEALKHKALPEAIDANFNTPFPQRLRIWSAASSTGQEPYSIAMTVCEMLPDAHLWDVNILATDICDAAVAKGSSGCYAKHELQRGMPAEMLAKYFDEEPGGWRVNDQLRSMIRFERRNLLKPFSELGQFDVIFCRNVAIYFETDVKRDLFNRLSDLLVPGGYLFVGSSEALNNLDPRFVAQQHCQTVFYQPNRQLAAATAVV